MPGFWFCGGGGVAEMVLNVASVGERMLALSSAPLVPVSIAEWPSVAMVTFAAVWKFQ